MIKMETQKINQQPETHGTTTGSNDNRSTQQREDSKVLSPKDQCPNPA